MLLAVFNSIIILLLVVIIISDFKQRFLYAWLLPVLVVGFILKSFIITGIDIFVISNWLYNIIIISLQFLVLWIYFTVIKKRSFNSLIGLGDILFLYTIAFSLPTLYFIITCTASYLIALIAKTILNKHFKTIPLAGWLAVTVAIILSVEIVKQQTCWDWLYLL